MVTQAPQIEWRAPWWEHVRPIGEAAWTRWCSGSSVSDALNRVLMPGTAPVRFVPQHALPEQLSYEQFIFDHQSVPTRENLHDFLNGLAWARYPRIKRRMNALQAAEIARDGIRSTRGHVRDAVTLLDESGVLLAAPQELIVALRERRWRELFGSMRALWAGARLWVIGHATLEKLVIPYKSITAHVLPVAQELQTCEQVDEWLANWLKPERLVPKPFLPLPLLGVPGWWSQNEDPEFYEDLDVFRPLRFHMQRIEVRDSVSATEPDR